MKPEIEFSQLSYKQTKPTKQKAIQNKTNITSPPNLLYERESNKHWLNSNEIYSLSVYLSAIQGIPGQNDYFVFWLRHLLQS